MDKQNVLYKLLKKLLRKIPPKEWSAELPNILLMLRTTPSAATGLPPCEILMGRRLTTLLDRLLPNNQIQKGSEHLHESHKFSLGDPVYLREYRGNKIFWKPGVIVGIEGPRVFKVDSGDGNIERRHLNQLRRRYSNVSLQFPQQACDQEREQNRPELAPLILESLSVPNRPASPEPGPPRTSHETSIDLGPVESDPDGEEVPRSSRPKRTIRPPSHLRDFQLNT